MNYRVIFGPQALDQLVELFRYIAEAASPDMATRCTDAIVSFCESLCLFPHRGIQRDDIRPGLRITNYKSRVVIAFAVDATVVTILGIFCGGQNYEAILQDSMEDDPWADGPV